MTLFTCLSLVKTALRQLNVPCEKVRTLVLQRCGLTALGDCFAAFKQLRTLDLSHNYFVNIPCRTFASLSWLSRLNLSSNRITVFDGAVLWHYAAKNRLWVNLSENRITGVKNLAFLPPDVWFDLKFNEVPYQSLPKALLAVADVSFNKQPETSESRVGYYGF